MRALVAFLVLLFTILGGGAHTRAASNAPAITVFHVNDTHARLTPHKWIIPTHLPVTPTFENVGGAAYLASAMLQLVSTKPDAIVIDAGDISEGNPLGDMNGNGAMTQFYQMLSKKLVAQRGRGIDAVVVGNHDVRSADYVANLLTLSASVPVISMNVLDATTHDPYFDPYTIVTVGGKKVGILGYTTDAAEVGASLDTTLEVRSCDWNSTDSTKIHIASYVNELRNNQKCDLVVLAAHVGHSSIATDTTRSGEKVSALLVDDGTAKLPELVITGHWHTWTSTVWQPETLNYKSTFAESSSYMQFIGEVSVDDTGRYLSSYQHVVRDADYTPDPDVQAFVDGLRADYDAAHPTATVDSVLGYTADSLMLDNGMRWWSADEYPWSGNNTAGQWICDAMQWKAAKLFGSCDLAIEAGGGVRADIPAGPVTLLQVYETFPWADDTFYRINMTGKEIVAFVEETGCDAGFSRALDVTAVDGVPTTVKFNGTPIDPAHVYTVAINNYMYNHPPSGWTWSDTAPLTSPELCRDGIIEYMQQFPSTSPYALGGARYHLNTEFSGGYRGVVTMMDDNDTKPSYEAAFVRLLSATNETLAYRGSQQVPTSLVGADGAVDPRNRLAEAEIYRSYLGFRTGALLPGDIIETWGKGSFYGGNPEFVDQEGVVSDGVEFRVVGHDDSLAKPAFKKSVGEFWNDANKNHYVSFVAKKVGTSTVVDQNGTQVSLMDATAYAAHSTPGSAGDMLLVSGVLTMESYGLRFRTDKVVLGSTVGITGFPSQTPSVANLDPLPSITTAKSVSLSATVVAGSGKQTLRPMADAYVVLGKPTSNYGTGTTLYVQSSAAGTYKDERGWLKFDLSSLPAGTTITSATLKAYCYKTLGASLVTDVCGGDSDTWTETGLTWNTQPSFGAALATQTISALNTWYSWDVTSFVQSKLAGDKLVSLVAKAQTEGSTDATAPSAYIDAKEYSGGSNSPVLEIVTSTSTPTASNVGFFYRYSTDNTTWGAWTLAGNSTAAPYTSNFDFPSGDGYYEFYALATDASSTTEAAPAAAEAAVHRVSALPYPSDVVVDLSNLAQVYSGAAKVPTVTTYPASVAVNVTYDGTTTPPVHAGSYEVVATVNKTGYAGSASAPLNILRASQTITPLTGLGPVTIGVLPFALTATAGSGLTVTFSSSNPQAATVSGNTVTIVGVGSTTITASQAGNADYLPAADVQAVLVVNPVVVVDAGAADASTQEPADAGADASTPPGTVDAGTDASVQEPADAGADASIQGPPDAGADASVQGPSDAGADASLQATSDAGADASITGPADASADASIHHVADASAHPQADAAADSGSDTTSEPASSNGCACTAASQSTIPEKGVGLLFALGVLVVTRRRRVANRISA